MDSVFRMFVWDKARLNSETISFLYTPYDKIECIINLVI